MKRETSDFRSGLVFACTTTLKNAGRTTEDSSRAEGSSEFTRRRTSRGHSFVLTSTRTQARIRRYFVGLLTVISHSVLNSKNPISRESSLFLSSLFRASISSLLSVMSKSGAPRCTRVSHARTKRSARNYEAGFALQLTTSLFRPRRAQFSPSSPPSFALLRLFFLVP